MGMTIAIDKLNKMPKSCKECPLTYLDSGDDAYFGATERRCVIDDSCTDGMVSERAYDCPLVEAIPKADYENRLKADMVAMLEEMQKAIGKAFGNEDDFCHMKMFTEDELEEIADHLYAVVKRARREQDNDSSNLDNSSM